MGKKINMALFQTLILLSKIIDDTYTKIRINFNNSKLKYIVHIFFHVEIK